MAKLKKGSLSPITILVIVIIIAAAGTWLLPSGEYNKLSYADGAFTLATQTGNKTLPFSQHTLDSLHIKIALAKFKSGDIRKPVAIPGSYHLIKKNGQGPVQIAQSPLKGIYDSVDIIFFVLFIGGFMAVFLKTGAMEQGIKYLSYRMKGKEAWLIITITFFFAFFGSAEGMAEEAMVFYPILVPLFIAAGYDLLVPVAVIFGGTSIGNLSSFCNPFATIIASNAAGINWADGLYERIAVFAITTIITIWYIVRYAQKVKKNPSASLVLRFDGAVEPLYAVNNANVEEKTLGSKNAMLLVVFISAILVMITGVVFFGWWLLEMSALFMVAALLVAVIVQMKESVFIESFIDGMRSLLSVALIIGVARGVTIILNDGRITDTILYYSAGFVGQMPAALFIIILFVLYMLFTLFISSSSGMAVLTMPIFGSLAVIVGVPGREIVNAYLFGMGIMTFLTPTGLILPSISLAKISLKTWWYFIYPLLAIISVVCAAFLIVGVL
jgi:uncharacterized ion transporter superfamily protein YfcC